MRTFLLSCLLFLPSLATAHEVVWTGVDYGLVHMIGTGDFREPEEIFPGYLDKWNVLVLDEQLDDLGKRLKSDIAVDVGHLTALHGEADADAQIIRNDLITTDDAVLTEAEVRARVEQYPLTRSGTGLVFIADQLNKPRAQGCYWVTFYDLESREVHSTDRRCGEARGFGFRNYWFGTVKAVIKTLRRSDLP